jgi:hypothetical protein
MKNTMWLFAIFLSGSAGLSHANATYPESLERTLVYYDQGVETDRTATLQLHKVSVTLPATRSPSRTSPPKCGSASQ